MMKIEILYKDKDIIAVNKPSGLIVHADGKTVEPTLVDWIAENFPEALEVGESVTLANGTLIKRPGIVHRLDRETSGVILVARTAEGHAHLKVQFQEHTIKKTYRTFVYGKVKNDEGVIDRPIGRSKNDFRKWTAERGTRGELREAVTNYKVIERGTETTYLEAYPKTGRTHQIRVHLKAISHPVVCDSLYAESRPSILGFSRLALHSYKITLLNLKNKEITVEAPLPQDFESALKELKKA
jgi:23S rRNA pseudouridine1911/1915/1917 synthase